MDNLFPLRDVIDICKVSVTNIGILSLDEDEVFNRIDLSICSVFSMHLVLGCVHIMGETAV